MGSFVILSSLPRALVQAKQERYHLRHGRRNQETFVNANPNFEAPFGLCEGDCDNDEDCEVGLICFQRGRNETVPGCSGGENDQTLSDYCILSQEGTPTDNATALPSEAPSKPSAQPTEFTPLGLCEGDCDFDSDCADGLYCFQRGPGEAVPGCAGKETDNSRTDYCTVSLPTSQPSQSQPPTQSAAPSSNPSNTPSSIPSDVPSSMPTQSAAPSSNPSKTPSNVPSVVPSSMPTQSSAPSSNPSDVSSSTPTQSVAPSLNPSDVPSLSPTQSAAPSSNPSNTPSNVPSVTPTQSVSPSSNPSKSPSLLLSETPSMVKSDYPSLKPSLQPSLSSQPTSKLGLCEGDCDNDNDCASDLYCFQRNGGEAVPGCSGSENDMSRTDYCAYKQPTSQPSFFPTNKPSISSFPSIESSYEPSASLVPSMVQTQSRGVLNAYPGVNPPISAFPLGLCEGDCDDDSDCGEGLYCYQRSNNEEVPGCIGGENDNSRNDYCTYLSFAPVAAPTSNSFRLQLYGEPEYSWTESNTNWCMDCRNGCFSGSQLYIVECSGRSTYFTFREASSDDILLEVVDSSTTVSLCMQRSGEEIMLQPCDQTKPLQRWYIPDNTTAGFEISQYGFPDYCISQDEQPVHGQTVKMEPYEEARSTNTSLWMKL